MLNISIHTKKKLINYVLKYQNKLIWLIGSVPD